MSTPRATDWFDTEDLVLTIQSPTEPGTTAEIYRVPDAAEPEPAEAYPTYPWADHARPTYEQELAFHEAGDTYGFAIVNRHGVLLDKWWAVYGMGHARAAAEEMLASTTADDD